MFFRNATNRERALQKKVRDLEALLDAKQREVAVLQHEVAKLAAVCARDLARVEAEISAANRRRAEMEGTQHDEFDQSARRVA